MDGDEEEESAQRRSLRHDNAPPAAKRLKIDDPQAPAPILRVTPIRATVSSSRSKAKPIPPAPSTSASTASSGSTRPSLPPTPKPGSLRLAAHGLRVPSHANVEASAAPAMSLRLRGGRGRLQIAMAWGEKVPASLLDGEPCAYELPWWVMDDESVHGEQEEADDGQDGEEGEDEFGMSAEERKEKKRQARNARQNKWRAARRERLAAKRKELQGTVESDEQEDELESESEAQLEMSAEERKRQEKRQAKNATQRKYRAARRERLAAECEELQRKREVKRIKDRQAREAKRAKKTVEPAGERADEDEDQEMENVSTVSPLTPSSLSLLSSFEPAMDMDMAESSPVDYEQQPTFSFPPPPPPPGHWKSHVGAHTSQTTRAIRHTRVPDQAGLKHSS
ncbi:hypothetical protein FB45DRAFT_921025 [Roridomyces roridus]|uniref:Uncharacterized protein n=1 Tax=Roridomyces roridus TaxID=1738132 RepID=A0AAD7BQZ6_9AGAR|nr:hypothetical protein FB45DRAFT_921025 [Roridomyces roridus]